MKRMPQSTSALEMDQRIDSAPPTATARLTDVEMRCRDALLLWLHWNDAYERVTEAMCRPGQTQDQLESLMDSMDQLRREAIAKSHELLDAQ
jgi:hypothetical protein